ncbi:MAG: hypothetical protein WCK90_04400 [archaeon]
MELKDLKKEYADLQKKYKLPSFKELNDDFEIDKIDRETDNMLRLIRKVMMEKIANSLAFVEMIANPGNAPRVYLNFIKGITNGERKDLEILFDKLGKMSMVSISAEIDYSEKKEAELIKYILKDWNAIKPNFRKIMEAMNVQQPDEEPRHEKSYYG